MKSLQKKNKSYRKNRLSRRIQNSLLRGNFVSTVIMLIIISLAIGSLVNFLGSGFTSNTARYIAKSVEQSYEYALSDEEFVAMVEKLVSDPNMVGDEDLLVFKKDLIESGDLTNLHDVEMTVDFLSSMRFYEYKITVYDQVVYDSYLMEEERGLKIAKAIDRDSAITVGLITPQEAAIRVNGHIIGTVEVSLGTDVLSITYMIAIALAVAVLLSNSIISKITGFVTSRVVSRPLEVLTDQMECLANEELEDAFNTHLEVKRPVSEVSSLMASTDKIMSKMSEYYQTMLSQNQELEAQRDVLENQRDELEAQNEELRVTSENLQSMNNAYLGRTQKLQNLMNNIGQGFMTFHEDLIINGEYSMACSEMLCGSKNEELKGRHVTEIFCVEDTEFLESLLLRIIKGNGHERELFMPLLPEEIEADCRTLKVEYKIVQDNLFRDQMMLILTDISHTRNLEQQMATERDALQMIVKVLTNRQEVSENIEDFKGFCHEVMIGNTKKNREELLRTIHTYKGTFSQYYMNTIADELNNVEDRAYKNETDITDRDISSLIKALDRDLNIIESYIGSDLITNHEMYTVKETTINDIENRIRAVLPENETQKVLTIINRIRYKSVKDMLKTYPDYTLKLSERLGKSVAPFKVEGDDIYVDTDIYQNLLKSLIHVFRNAVDHGVEDADSRIEGGKPEIASMSCEVRRTDNSAFTITIRDDGRGIDTERIGEKALAAGMVTDEALSLMSHDEKLQLVFNQGISIKERATAISGRGVGLAAVKDMVESLEGQVTVKSINGEGTEFFFEIPYIQAAETKDISAENFVEAVVAKADDYFNTLPMAFEMPAYEASDRIKLHHVSALLNISGSVDGLVILSGNESCIREMVNAFILEPIDPGDFDAYGEDVLGEVTNTILGNTLGKLEEEGIHVTMGVPVMISNSNAYMKYTNRKIYTAKYSRDDMVMTISLLLAEA